MAPHSLPPLHHSKKPPLGSPPLHQDIQRVTFSFIDYRGTERSVIARVQKQFLFEEEVGLESE